MKVVIERFISKTKSIYNFLLDKKYLVVFFLFVSILIIFIGRSLAALTPVSSITVPSTVLSYSDKEEGSWQYTKSAHWISNNQARIDIELNTTMKKNTNYTDIILVIDNSKRMVRSRMTPVQQYVSEFIDSAVVDGNKMSIITFNDNAFAETDFTDDTSALQDSLYNMSATGGSSYYQALLAIDSLLSSYNKEANRDCVVIFLTGSLPTVDTPNEVGEYNYLKSKYNYLNINAIQYDLADGVLDDVKNISDVQYVVGSDELLDALNDASVVADNYDKLIFTDYLDTNYFNLNGVSKITTSFGTATINNNKVVWNLNGMESGKSAKLSIDINLNNDLVGVEGIYPTHTTADVLYKIGKADTTESTSKTTVLKDNYTVFYEANSPSGCIVSNMPSSKNYLVFDTVQLENKIPKCIGYQFKGWKIVNSGVKKFNDDSFSMPAENVTLRATWSKIDLNKSSDGTVQEAASLYKVLENEANSGGLAKEYTGSHQDSMAGSGTEKIYHYYASTDSEGNEVQNKNNIIFAGFCWQMLRTTDTGGVKIIYNGEPDVNGKCGTDRGTHIGYSDRATPNFAKSLYYGTGYVYDEETAMFSLTGDLVQATWSDSNYENLLGKYVCWPSENTTSCSTLYYVDSYSSSTRAVVFKISKEALYSGIGGHYYNAGNELDDIGYMYSSLYPEEKNSSTGTFKFGNSFTYRNGRYTLSGTTKTWSLANYNKDTVDSELGKTHYTCFNTSGSCTTLAYVINSVGESSTDYLRYISLENGFGIDEALDEMFSTNTSDSIAKRLIDAWYKNYMINYTSYLEDTVFCNDRSIKSAGPFNPSGGIISGVANFNASTDDLSCSRVSDRFSVSNEKAKLTYPVALPTMSEVSLLGNNNARKSANTYVLMTPYDYFHAFTEISYVSSTGATSSGPLTNSRMYRPVVSLKPGIKYSSGNGSVDNPYIVDVSS